MNKLAAILIVCFLAVPAMAQWPPAQPYLAGDFNGWNAAGDIMTETSPGSGIWTKSFNGWGVGERHEFKVTDGTWTNNYPGSGNSWFYIGGDGNATVTYDSTTYADGWLPVADRIGLSVDPGSWTAVGDWQGWVNNNPATAMVAQGGGIYKYQQVLAPGSYQYKAVFTGTWDAIGIDSRGVNSATLPFTTDAVNDTAIFWVNAATGAIKLDLVPEPATLGMLLIGGLALLRRR